MKASTAIIRKIKTSLYQSTKPESVQWSHCSNQRNQLGASKRRNPRCPALGQHHQRSRPTRMLQMRWYIVSLIHSSKPGKAEGGRWEAERPGMKMKRPSRSREQEARRSCSQAALDPATMHLYTKSCIPSSFPGRSLREALHLEPDQTSKDTMQ